jgi:hypothetical protein
MRIAALALLLTTALATPAMAQTTSPSATPTNGAVGSAAQRNGYPAAGGAVALPAIGPSIANSSTTTTTPLAGTTTSPALSSSTASTLSTGAGGSPAIGGTGQTGGNGGAGFSGGAGQTRGGAGRSNFGGGNTAGTLYRHRSVLRPAVIDPAPLLAERGAVLCRRDKSVRVHR